jgi:hypothetical protein
MQAIKPITHTTHHLSAASYLQLQYVDWVVQLNWHKLSRHHTLLLLLVSNARCRPISLPLAAAAA